MRVHIRSSVSLACVAMAAGCAAQPPIVLQAEQAKLSDLAIATTRPGHEGAGYVYGFLNDTGELTFTFEAPRAGIYDLHIRYTAPSGGKGYTLSVNDVGSDGFLPPSPETFATFDAGKVELVKGQNKLMLGKGWGRYEIDSLRLQPSNPYPIPRPIAPQLSNPDATPEARQRMKQLADAYRKVTFAGVMEQKDFDYVREVTGVTPTIMGGDLIDYSPSRRAHNSDPKNETERLIAAHRAGQIVTLCWHWNAPKDLIDQKEFVNAEGKTIDASWYLGFYTKATTFDFTKGVEDESSEEHALLLRDVDAIAVELKKLSDAHVPVLWRPLHESDGAWFWWGARGPEHFKKLWRLMYERLTVHHKLNNLIWVFTWNNNDWYPGDDVVDIVGLDIYPSKVNDTLATKWGEALRRFDGKKLITLSEYGGVPDVARMMRLGIRWSYFVSWTGPNGPRKNEKDDLIRIYRSPAIATVPRGK